MQALARDYKYGTCNWTRIDVVLPKDLLLIKMNVYREIFALFYILPILPRLSVHGRI